MAIEVVAASTFAATSPTDPYTHSVPLPDGTEVGDTVVVGVVQPSAVISDSRLQVVAAFGASLPFVGGAVGQATDLSDVEVVMHDGAPGLVTIVTLRGVDGLRGRMFVDGTPEGFTSIALGPGADTAMAGVVVVSASGATMGPSDGTWTEHDVAYEDSADASVTFGIQAYSWVAGPPLPALVAADGDSWSSVPRSLSVQFQPALASRPYLRQRQSPLWVPSRNSDAYRLRNNQTPYL